MTDRTDGVLAPTPWRVARWAVIAAILATPLVAMLFTDQVAWTAFDFACAAVLLVGAGAAYEVVERLVRRPRLRLALAATLASLVLLTWAQGAVGVF